MKRRKFISLGTLASVTAGSAPFLAAKTPLETTEISKDTSRAKVPGLFVWIQQRLDQPH